MTHERAMSVDNSENGSEPLLLIVQGQRASQVFGESMQTERAKYGESL